MSRTIRIASRRSKMALSQTNRIIGQLQQIAPENTYKIVEIVSDGCYERFKGDLTQIGGKGAFVKALEHAMLNDKADIAMHSMKDVPTDEEIPAGLMIGAVLEREDIRDAVICRQDETFEGLQEGATIGTSSVRRAAQIKASFPHLEVKPIRGNADTRIAKLDAKEYDAIVLARCGLARIGASARVSLLFEPDIMCPALGQGIVGIECREEDSDIHALLNKINHVPSYTCLMAERAMLTALNGSCHTPIAGYCEVTKNNNLRLIGMVSSLDGKKVIRGREKFTFDKPTELGQAVAQQLLDQGAAELLATCEEKAAL